MIAAAVCLGFRNWHVPHLERCVETLQRGGLPIVIADLGSRPSLKGLLGDWPLVTVVEAPAVEWSRSVALNTAARACPEHIKTLVFTDADMLFPASWFGAMTTAVTMHDHNNVWLTDSRDLSPLAGGRSIEWWMDDAWLHRVSVPHDRVGQGAAMVIPRKWFESVGGFDEYYRVWGAEDNDLVLRAEWAGLTVDWLGPPEAAWVTHQWHRRDWATPAQLAQVQRNRAYLAERIAESGPIVRNTHPLERKDLPR